MIFGGISIYKTIQFGGNNYAHKALYAIFANLDVSDLTAIHGPNNYVLKPKENIRIPYLTSFDQTLIWEDSPKPIPLCCTIPKCSMYRIYLPIHVPSNQAKYKYK